MSLNQQTRSHIRKK